MFSAIISFFAGLFGKLLGGMWPSKSPSQEAVDVQRKMDNEAINSPTQANAVRSLEDGDA